MNELKKTDALLKRYLKGKFSLTKAVVVSFLITGAMSFAGSNGPAASLAKKYMYNGPSVSLVAPTVETTTFTTQSPLVTPTQVSTGATQDVSSTDSANPSVFTPIATTPLNLGLWVTASAANVYGTNTTDLTNTTASSYGIAIVNPTNSIASYTNSATVTATGTNSYGVFVQADAEDVTFSNSGTVKGSGLGLLATTAGAGNVTIKNTGSIADGVVAVGGATAAATGTVYIENSNVVTGNMVAQAGVAGTAQVTNNGLVTGNMVAVGGSTGTATVINNNVVYGNMYATGSGATATNAGQIDHAGDYGMSSVSGGTINNNGNIINTGNYGMIASGVGSEAVNLDNINNGSIVAPGLYGMVALDGATAINGSQLLYAEASVDRYGSEGVVANTGDYGMVASGVSSTDVASTAINIGKVVNDGNYGMAAFAGALVTNGNETTLNEETYIQDGIVENFGNVGMLASGVGSRAVNYGTVQNDGTYGMMALNSGRITNEGIVQNKGDVGMYVDSTSVGYNDGITAIVGDNEITGYNQLAEIRNQGNVGVFNDGYFVNKGTINPLNLNNEATLYAVVNGYNNGTTAFINPGVDGYNPTPNSGTLINTGGTDVLQFGSDVGEGTSVLNSNANYYNYIVGSGWERGDDIPTYGGIENTWTLNGYHYMLGGAPLSNADSALANAISDNKGGILDTDIVLGKTGRVDMIMGRSKDVLNKGTNYFTSPTIFADSYNPTAGTHNNIALDRTFITSQNKVTFNIAQVNESIGPWSVPTTDTIIINLEDAKANNINTLTVSEVVGWSAHYELDSAGNLNLVYVKDTGMLGNGTTTYTAQNKAPGGYGDANSYPHSNLDTVNARHIIDRGYLYARKAAFMRPEVTEETVTYPAPVADKPAKSVPMVTEKGKEVVQPPMIEEVVKTYKNYENLQFAEVFGDWGSYSGSGAKYNFDTVGVTGATFHKFHDYPEWMMGLSYGYAHSKVDYKHHEGSDEKLNTLGINAFLSWAKDNWLVTGQFGYSWSKHDLKRNFLDYDAPFLGYGQNSLKRQASKKFDSHQWGLGFEMGYNYVIDPTFTVYPYVGFDYIWNSRDSYTENADGWSGSEAWSGTMTLDKYTLDVNKNKYDTGVVKLGAMAEKLYERWTFTLDAAWKYYTDDYKPLKGTYVDATERGENVYFQSHHLDVGKSLGYVNVGVDYAVTPQLSVGVEYTGYYRSKQSGSLFGGNLTYKF